MINKNKTHRLMIQISKKQYNWLLNKSNQLNISISQLVRWLLNKKIKDINDIKQLNTKPKESIEINDTEVYAEEWSELIKEATDLLINKPN